MLTPWNENPSRNLRNPGGMLASAQERVKEGAKMAAWELVIGTWANPILANAVRLTPYIGEILAGPPVDHEQLQTKIANDLEPVIGKTLAGMLDKAITTFENIAVLHPFFSFGSPGTNYASKVLEKGSEKFSVGANRLADFGKTILKTEGRTAKFYAVAAGVGTLKAASWGINNIGVNPIAMKTFFWFEDGAVRIASAVGLMKPVKFDEKEGKWFEKDRDGNVIRDKEGNGRLSMMSEVFKFLGFISAPVHAGNSAAENYLTARIEKGAPSFLRTVLGGKPVETAERRLAVNEAKRLQNHVEGRKGEDFVIYRFRRDAPHRKPGAEH
jgi:hypothetical protein